MLTTIPFSLSPQQKNDFVQNGYVRLPGVVNDDLLHRLSDAVECLCADESVRNELAVTSAGDGKQYVFGIDKIVARTEPVFAELLGSPMLLSLAEQLCGEDFFPVQDFTVIKSRGDDNEVKWHQDVLTKPLGKTIMVGFYLDAADEENGALRVVPGSQHSGLPICELEKQPYVSIAMHPGDILIHDLMVAHSSGLLTTTEKRRVVYFEFMSAAQVLEENIYPEEFVQLRTGLIPVMMQYYAQATPGTAPFEWKHPQRGDYTLPADPAAAIRSVYDSKWKVKAASYCFENL